MTMRRKYIRILLPGLVLTLFGLSGCGWQAAPSQTGTNSNTGNAPDRVQIAIHTLDAQTGKPLVTLVNVSLVQQLYATFSTLSPFPANAACTDEMGPGYTLTFFHGQKTLATGTAQRYGCGRVSIVGEAQDRVANKQFWTQLDQAIYQATPVASPEQVAILHTLQIHQPPLTAQITSPEIAQRLYRAILALPLTPQNSTCTPEALPTYQLVFHTANQAIPSVIDQKCQTISLSCNFQSRSGIFTMNGQFQQLFAQTVAGATFAPAQPDRLTLDVEPERGTAHQGIIADTALRQQLYTKIFALPTGKAQPNCPAEADKIAGKGTWYMLSFTQWDLPILPNVDAYEGSCKFLSLDAGQATGGGLILQTDNTFWNLVHQAAGK